MAQREYILQELRAINSSLAGIEKHPMYEVPMGYFDNLAGEIMRKVRASDAATANEELFHLSPMLNDLSKRGPYSVPAGYFDSIEKKLAEIIFTSKDQTVEEELETLSPLLLQLRDKPTYSVPEHYFEQLDQATPVQARKVFSIARSKWVRYAAAAIVVGLVATIGFRFLNKKETAESTDKSLAWVEKNLKKVSTDDISAFVESVSTESTDIVKTETKDEVRNLLKDVTDKEIQDFLNDTQVDESESNDDLILN
jgi:hypothetical protein